MNKFKIGDKVRVINNDQRYSEDFTGQESEVINSGPDWYEIKVQYKHGGYNFLTFNENELELVDNAPRSFKVGDRVRFDCSGFEVDYGTIVERHTENSWWIDWESDGDRCHCEEKYLTVVDSEEQVEEPSSKTKSDGGSSDYYKLEINGNSIEVEDVIYAMVGGDFALGNALKALRRMYLDSKGQGKEGIDMQYDANKIKYFVDSFVERFGGE